MFVAITNTPRPYAWGSRTAIAELLGRTPSGDPEAELWLGAHAGSPSAVVDPSQTGGARTLDEWIAADPQSTLGADAASARLPFLLKILAAESPLSLQAHPTPEQAREGFEREEAAGVPIDAAERNYKDEFPKPELIYALSDTFEALCGFRSVGSFRESLLALGDPQLAPLIERASSDEALPELVRWLSGGGPEIDAVVDRVSSAPHAPELITRLAAQYPGDPGIVIALMLNHVTLQRGEALYLPAGNIHAYISGLGVELMIASDNVLRGGLTPKHVDVAELLRVLDFSVAQIPYLAPTHPRENVELFASPDREFALAHVTGTGTLDPGGPAIAICTSGSFEVAGRGSTRLNRGDAVFITPDEGSMRIDGAGELFVAMTNGNR